MTGYEPLNTLKRVAPDLWIVDGPQIRFFRIPFSTRMTVIRLRNGDLFLHSPTHLTDSLAAEVAAQGAVRHLVSPNWIHYASIAQWAKAFPGAIAWASPNVRSRAAKAGIEVHFDRDLGEVPAPEWAADIDQMIVHGSRMHEEVVFFHRASMTLILTDLIANLECAYIPLWFQLVARMDGVLDPYGQMPRDMRLTFWWGRLALRASVQTMLAWKPERVILAHGRWYPIQGVEELQRAFRWVLR
jgi:hypothetical protein